VTYYQAQGLSGHTSPCGELACFWQTLLCRKVKWAHFIRKQIFFLKEHHAFFEQPTSSILILVNWFSCWSKYRCNCLGDFPYCRSCQVLLVEEAQDGVLHHNTRCSETSCGGINPYTLTVRLGLGGLAHHETVRSLIQLLGVSRKETRRGDQAKF